jgi:hypothetical protein
MAPALRVWLHAGHDGDPGVVALGLEHLGFSTWAETERDVLEKLPAKFAEYGAWRRAHRLPVQEDAAPIEVAGRQVGNEILFPADLEPASPAEIELAIELLAASRADLMTELEAAPEGAFDWDPPYRRFASWADWRTVRAILAHIANGETHYYARSIGHLPLASPAPASGDWRVFLRASRAEALAFLEELARSPDLHRVRSVDHGFGEEWWFVRKALRRLVSRELGHAKSIRRILREYRAAHPSGDAHA